MKKAVGNFKNATYEERGHFVNANGDPIWYLSASARPISGTKGKKRAAFAIFSGERKFGNIYSSEFGVKAYSIA